LEEKTISQVDEKRKRVSSTLMGVENRLGLALLDWKKGGFTRRSAMGRKKRFFEAGMEGGKLKTRSGDSKPFGGVPERRKR